MTAATTRGSTSTIPRNRRRPVPVRALYRGRTDTGLRLAERGHGMAQNA
ncbi:MAG: hypothetical protein Q7I89_00820 [Syntrophales bacterium]|nr:hypothetical protein [Syntrophales bacterium]